MINWQKTKSVYGYDNNDKFPKNAPIICECDDCGAEIVSTKQRHYTYCWRAGKFRCAKCGRSAMATSVSSAITDKWADQQYRSKQRGRKHSDELKENARRLSKVLWQDPQYIAKFKAGFNHEAALANLDKCRASGAKAAGTLLKRQWADLTYAEKMSAQSRALWADDNYRLRVITGLKDHFSNPNVLTEASERAKRLWQNSGYRDRWLKSFLESFTGDRIDEISLRSAKNWMNADYRGKIESKWDESRRQWMAWVCRDWWTDDKRAEVAATMIERWDDQDFRNKCIAAFIKSWTPERRQAAVDSWTPERRQAASDRARALWTNPDFVAKMTDVANRPSSLEIQFASILDDYDVKYEQQCHIGPYLFDFRIDNTLVEIQGDYWHTLERNIVRDQAKATYVNKYFPQYKLIYIWEHEFYQLDKIRGVVESIFSHVGAEIVEFEFDQLILDAEVQYDEAVDLFNKYHYKGSIGRSGMILGVRLSNRLVAACVFGTPTRNVPGGELLRFVIDPHYQKHNLASWFLSRASKLAYERYGELHTFSDPNFNHSGTIYLAANWKYSGDTKPDYWYVSQDGWVMHKKTLWNRAVNLSMREAEYADAFGYSKVWGLPKKKFIYNIKAK